MRRCRSGSNAVEFALTLPVIIFILSGVVDYSYYFHLQYNMINAVAQGVRAGVEADPIDDDPIDIAQQVADAVWDAAELQGAPTFVADWGVTTPPDRTLVLTGEMNFVNLVGVLPTPTQVKHVATMRMIDQDVPDTGTP